MNNLPPLTTRIDKGAGGGHEFERLLNQLLILFANHHEFDYEPVGGAGGDGGLDGLARQGGVPGMDGPAGFQFKWLWDGIHKGSKATQITDSLTRAAKNFPFLRHWILVTPHDLTPTEQKWLLAQNPRPDLTLHHWGQARVEGLLREHAPKAFARYYPHTAGGAPSIEIHQSGSGTIVMGDGNAVASGKGKAVVVKGNVHGDINFGNAGQKPTKRDLASAYLAHVIRECKPLKLRGIDQRAARPNSEPLSLSSVYVDLETSAEIPEDLSLSIFLAILTNGKAVVAPGEWRSVAALERVACHRHLVLLGAPGSGKSTLVQYLALRLAEARQGNKKSLDALGKAKGIGALLPVRVTLRQFAASLPTGLDRGRAGHLWDFISSELKACGLAGKTGEWVKSEALESGALFLLDGLDETRDASVRARVVEVVAEFAKSAGEKSRFLLTSRPYAWEEVRRSQQADTPEDPLWPVKQSFAEVLAVFRPFYHIADFEPEQTDLFIERWYYALEQREWLTPADAAAQIPVLQQAARRHDLVQIARNPLLLTLMATLHSNRTRLPDDRADLYNEVVELLLQRWNENIGADRGLLEALQIPTLKLSDLRGRIEQLAYEVHGGHVGKDGVADIAEGRLNEAFRRLLGGSLDKAALVVDYIEKRAGLLVGQGCRKGENQFTFPHRTFQEFLAGCYLAGCPDFEDKVRRLSEENPDHWREVLKISARRATASRGVPAADLLVGHRDVIAIKEPDPRDFRKAVLAAEQLLEIGLAAVTGDPAHDVIRQRIAGWLVALLERGSLPVKERVQAGELLAGLGDPRLAVVPRAPEDLGAMEFCLVPAGSFIMGEDSNGRDKRHRNRLLDRLFWISRNPVTVAQFELFVKAGGYGVGEFWTEAEAAEIWKNGKLKDLSEQERRDRPPFANESLRLPNHPVVGLTWYEAQAFTRWLDSTWRDSLLPGYRLKLPSEAEWEKAARGGDCICHPAVIRPLADLGVTEQISWVKNPQPERIYPWGDAFDEDMIHCDITDEGTTSAAGCFIKASSPCGVQDMTSVVWEWTRSRHISYPYINMDEIGMVDQLSTFVARGGSFFGHPLDARCAARYGRYVMDRSADTSLRVVLTPF